MDILKFSPNCKAQIFVLPFKPFQKPTINVDNTLKKYNLPNKYFIIANQFWTHKNHITAFEALEQVYCKGYIDIHIVCTGKMEDYRDPNHIVELGKRINEMHCKKNIHFLGYIPKDEQIEVMRKASGLIQPTLFEGTPGGGSVYNALCLGLTCLVSDIPVNREIQGYRNVYFFESKNVKQLAQLIIDHIDDGHIDINAVNKKIISNKMEYGNFIYEKISEILRQNY